MVSSWLGANRGGSWTTQGPAAQGWNYGITGIPDVSGFLTKVRWYRATAGAGSAPSRVQVWDRTAQSVIFELGAPPDNNLVGWQEYVVLTDIPLYAGHDYTASLYVDPGENFYHTPFANRGAAGDDWSFSPSPAHTAPNASFGFPINLYNTVLPGVDMEWSDVGGAGGTDPGDYPTIQNDLASWLHRDDAPSNNPLSLPYLNHEELTSGTHGLALIKGIADDLLATIDNAMGPGGSLITGTLRPILDAMVADLEDHMTTKTAEIMGPSGPTLAFISNQIASLPPASCGFPLTVGDADWTEGDQTVGSGGFAWLEPADAYRVHIEEIAGEARTALQVGAETIYWMRGWARPWNGAEVYPQSIPLVGLDAVIISGERWPGIMLWFPPGVEWVLTAYDYTP